MNRLAISPTRLPQTMARLAYFQGWPMDVLVRLSAGAKVLSLEKNDWLGRKGDPLQSLYVVMDGLIRCFIPLPNNTERVVSLVDTGHSFGEASLMLQAPSPYHAVAGRDTRLLAVDAMVFRREIGQNLNLCRQTLERVAVTCMDNLRDTEISAQRSSAQRVASYLMQHQPSPDSQAFPISLPGRKQDVAAKLGLTQETFSRVLHALDKQGVIQITGSRINVADGRKLAEMTTKRQFSGQGTALAN
ncbi:MAG: Crp/Fnr family transcriptional regulator [Pseudomonadota bacterium]